MRPVHITGRAVALCYPLVCSHTGEVVMTGCCRRGRMFFAVATAGLGCVVVVLAGCSSSSSKTTTSTAAGSPSSSSSTAAASPSVSPASAAQLAKIVLQPVDFPAGPASWAHTPYKPDPAGPATGLTGAEFAKCAGVPNSYSEQVAEAHSGDFDKGIDQGDAEISSDAYSFRSQSAVDVDVAALHRAKAEPCYEQEARQALAGGAPPGGTIELVSFKLTPGSAGGGPANVVATTVSTFKITSSGTVVKGSVSVAFITGPLIEVAVTTTVFEAPIPASFVDSLVAAVASRAAQPLIGTARSKLIKPTTTGRLTGHGTAGS